MQPDQATNNGGRTMEVVAAAPRCQLLLIVLMAAMLLPGMKVSPLLVRRKITRTMELQESIGKEHNGMKLQGRLYKSVDIEQYTLAKCGVLRDTGIDLVYNPPDG
ncbi:hypothetical protein STEG23_021319 [Scotinomys teguina]